MNRIEDLLETWLFEEILELSFQDLSNSNQEYIGKLKWSSVDLYSKHQILRSFIVD